MKPSVRWPLGIAAILGITVAGNIGVMFVARNDPSFAVEPDYYAKAITWDSSAQIAEHSRRLGWVLHQSLTPYSADSGAVLVVTITDSAGRPIDDATIRVEAMYNARASEIVHRTLAFERVAYTARMPVFHSGEWEFRFDVRRGEDHFITKTRVDAVRQAAGRSTGNGS